jgi:quercetin dioxygenase-like cupin family protein
MGKTIEVDPYKVTDLIVYEKKEKSIIVVAGVLSLAIGKCCDEDDLNYEELPAGWSRHIPAGMMHRYGATDKPLMLIEVSSPEMDEAILIDDLRTII